MCQIRQENHTRSSSPILTFKAMPVHLWRVIEMCGLLKKKIASVCSSKSSKATIPSLILSLRGWSTIQARGEIFGTKFSCQYRFLKGLACPKALGLVLRKLTPTLKRWLERESFKGSSTGRAKTENLATSSKCLPYSSIILNLRKSKWCKSLL